MTAHDKDPELRFVTAIFTYISYFVLIMVRTDTFPIGILTFEIYSAPLSSPFQSLVT